MKNISVFIESYGKTKKIKSLFEELGFLNVNVIATRGRLLDLPSSEYAINNEDFSDFKRVPLCERKQGQVTAALMSSDIVFLLTDDDIEGEVIAYDISNLLPKEKEVEVYRVRLQSITEDSLRSALGRSDSIIKSKVVGGLSRRIFDRYLGYNFTPRETNDGSEHRRIGRIITPAIAELEKSEPPKAWITRAIDLNGDCFNIKIPVYPDELEMAKDIFSFIDELGDPDIEVFAEDEYEDDAEPWNGTDALIALSSALSESISEISEVLQELYEEGKISYPRTDSFYLSEETSLAMKKMAQVFGVSGFDDEFFLKKAEAMRSRDEVDRTQDAHEALVPLSSELNIFTPLSDLSLKDKVMSIITRNCLRSGQKERKINKKKASLISSKNNSNWESVLSRFRGEIRIEQEYSQIGLGPKSEINNECKPFGSLEGSMVKNRTLMRVIDNQEIALMKIREIKLGRPSTDSSNSYSIANLFMNENGSINKEALASIDYARQVAPNLLDPKVASQVEDILHNVGGTIDERVKMAIELSGITSSSIKTKFESDVNSEHSGGYDSSSHEF